MKRLFVLLPLLLLTLVLFAPLRAQEKPEVNAAKSGEGHGEEQGDPYLIWKIANFVILAGALGYMIGKKAGPFFKARTAEIQQGIVDAAKMKQEADSSVAESERSLENLPAVIAEIRKRAMDESNAEAARAKQEAAGHIAKIRANAEQEIASATKAARHELKAYTADLAISLAQRKLLDQITPEVRSGAVETFLAGLKTQAGSHEGEAR